MTNSDYAVKAVNTLTDNSLDASIKERKRQLKIIDELFLKESRVRIADC